MPVEVFSIFWVLKEEGISEPESKALQMKEAMDKYPHYKKSAEHQRKIKQELYKILILSGIEADKTTAIAPKVMRVLGADSK